MKNNFFFTSMLMFSCLACFAQTTFTNIQSESLPLPNGDTPYNIDSGLIDNNTSIDIVFGTYDGGSVFWMKNDGLGNFTLQTEISTTLTTVADVTIADVDGDGDNDVLASSYSADKLVWFTNDGNGNFSSEIIISNIIDGAGEIKVGDINNDTILDVAIVAFDANSTVWFPGNGDGTFGAINTIDNTLASPSAFDIKDFDGDTDLDVVIVTLVAGSSQTEVFYNQYIESGTMTVSFIKDTNTISSGKEQLFDVAFEDLDNDNDLDVITADIFGNLEWYKKETNGTYTETTFTSSISNFASLDFKDLDNDGLKDVIAGSGLAIGNQLVWFKNNDLGNYAAEAVIDNIQAQVFSLTVNDFNNDNDIDIASVSYLDDKINIFDNESITLNTSNTEITNTSIFPNPVSNNLFFKLPIDRNYNIELLDVLGRKISNNTISKNTSLNLSSLKQGIYFIRFKKPNKIIKFLKK